MDLTVDNVHVNEGDMMVFDLDSAGESWRAGEPYGVLMNSEAYFQNWLEGYRSIRNFSKEDEQAVYAFVIIGEIRNVTWKLGLAKSSRGKPLMVPDELPKVIDEWLSWEQEKLK
jgi:Ser/Thr protein kinase RdoA (MazF antagonist)